MNTSSVDRKLGTAETALADLAADPYLSMGQRRAVRGCLSTVRGVGLMRRHALLRPVPSHLSSLVPDRKLLAAGDDSFESPPDAA